MRYLEDIDKFLVKDPTVTSTSDTRIGGLPARVIRGTGTRDGRGINFTATIIDLPKDRVAVVVAILRDGADPAYVDVLNDVFASFRAVAVRRGADDTPNLSNVCFLRWALGLRASDSVGLRRCHGWGRVWV